MHIDIEDNERHVVQHDFRCCSWWFFLYVIFFRFIRTFTRRAVYTFVNRLLESIAMHTSAPAHQHRAFDYTFHVHSHKHTHLVAVDASRGQKSGHAHDTNGAKTFTN